MARAAAAILHADLDAFYASVEQLLDPSLRGQPIAVGGGVVLAASYEAKAFGVQGGMSGRRARELCPPLRFVGGHFREYQRLGDEVIAVLRDFTPLVERISIDEAFLDVSGALRLFGEPRAIAERIRHRVRTEIGLAISIGAATTKHLAKVASQVAKPDGLVVVEPGTEESFLQPLPVDLLWGVGPATKERLTSLGIRTIGELARTAPSSLESLLGRAIGQQLGARANNEDERRIETQRRARSIGSQSALGRQVATEELLRRVLARLADRVAARLRAASRAARTITVRVRFADLRSVTRAATLAVPTCATGTIIEVAVALAQTALDDHPDERHISLLAIAASNLVDGQFLQMELPLEADAAAELRREETRLAVDRAIDDLRERFGKSAVGYAALLGQGDGVPDEFRELAEREL